MTDLHSNTRRVAITHDGRRIGHVEPLGPGRKGHFKVPSITPEVQRNALAKSNTIGAAQKRSATRRGKR